MKQWKETTEILARASQVAREGAGRQVALATVVRVEGSAYRRPGAKMLVEPTGRRSGGVSGGCLEDEVREVAAAVLRSGAPRLIHYETGADDETGWGLGLGCPGSVDVFVEALSPGDPLHDRIRDLLRGDAPFAVVTAIEGREPLGAVLVVAAEGATGSTGDLALDAALTTDARARLATGESGIHPAGDRRYFAEVLRPPPHLLLCGAGDDARPLAARACEAGFRVTVADHRPALLTPDRFSSEIRLVTARPEEGLGRLPIGPRTHAVVMTHSLTIDRDWIARLLDSAVAYIGVLGPRSRTDEILRRAGAADDPRVFAPVGLDLAADGAEQIALSVVAELLAVRAGRDGRHLRERTGAIHAG